MFDDIILEKPKQEVKKNCGTCGYGSWIASKENGRVYCGPRKMHMHPGFVCPDWKRKE